MQVSVVIPLYNKLHHIRRAVDSVLTQTCRDLELIVVDDGSTDGGGDVVREITDPRILLITRENAGVSAARNRGVQEASSELVAFLDADDAWDPDFLETVLSLRNRFPQAAIWGTAYRIARRNGVVAQARYHGQLPTSDEGGLMNYFGGQSGFSPLTPSSAMLRKNGLLAAGGFPVGVVYGEDHDTWLRLALRFPIAWTPRVKAIVFENAANRTDLYIYLGNYPFFESVRAFLKEDGQDHPLPAGLHEYLAWRHTGLLFSKWLAGERSVLEEIVRDCRHIKGYRLKCCWWYFLSWVPHPLVTFAWRIRRRLAGREGELPQFRSIRHTPSLRPQSPRAVLLAHRTEGCRR